MNAKLSFVFCAIVALGISGCAVGVKRTAGMNMYANGDYAGAIPALEAEVASGSVEARYSLGLAYRDGAGVAKDAGRAEILLTGAAIGGDPRAVAAIRAMLKEQNLCPKDKRLHDAWGSFSTSYRNIITGVVELNSAPPGALLGVAAIYDAPCEGRPVQAEAARSIRSLAGGPRHIWIYSPG